MENCFYLIHLCSKFTSKLHIISKLLLFREGFLKKEFVCFLRFQSGMSLQSPLELHTYKVSRFRWFSAIFGILLGLSALIVVTWAFTASPRDHLTNIRRGIVIDAGSSHTSFKIFEWPLNLESRPDQLLFKYLCYG